jgi:predicted nucleotidyltransferase
VSTSSLPAVGDLEAASAPAARTGTSQAAVARREGGLEEPRRLSTLSRLLYACEEILELTTRALPPSTRRDRLQDERSGVLDVLAASGATNPRLFGSLARGDDDEASDVDILVDLNVEESRASQLMTVLGLGVELSRVLGCRVHVASPETLRPEVLEQALAEAVPL